LWAIRLDFLAYVLSFAFVAVIWVNHHHIFQLADQVNTRVVWADVFWLFWLTLAPAVTIWTGDHPFDRVPELAYAFVFMMWSISFGLLNHELLKIHGPNSRLVQTLGHDKRTEISMIINVASFIGVFFFPILGLIGRLLVTVLWVRLPNNRDEGSES
jgi:uncharacterized membrane protein